MELDPDTIGLTELIKLQNLLTEVAKRRFERQVALVFSDILGATAYFARFGDQAGRALLQQHIEVITEQLEAHQGRIVDTAGDGAFVVFPTVTQAARAMVGAQEKISEVNSQRPRDHQLEVRQGIHWGPALTDGVLVTGDSVNLCARINSTGKTTEIRLSRSAFLELEKDLRLRCEGLPPAKLKGIAEPVEEVLRVHPRGVKRDGGEHEEDESFHAGMASSFCSAGFSPGAARGSLMMNSIPRPGKLFGVIVPP